VGDIGLEKIMKCNLHNIWDICWLDENH